MIHDSAAYIPIMMSYLMPHSSVRSIIIITTLLSILYCLCF